MLTFHNLTSLVARKVMFPQKQIVISSLVSDIRRKDDAHRLSQGHGRLPNPLRNGTAQALAERRWKPGVTPVDMRHHSFNWKLRSLFCTA